MTVTLEQMIEAMRCAWRSAKGRPTVDAYIHLYADAILALPGIGAPQPGADDRECWPNLSERIRQAEHRAEQAERERAALREHYALCVRERDEARRAALMDAENVVMRWGHGALAPTAITMRDMIRRLASD